MIPGFGKEQISLGSAPDNDVVLQGPGVAPQHARHREARRRSSSSSTTARRRRSRTARPSQPNQPVPFDFRTQFALGQVPVPLSHPAIVMMIMARGQASGSAGHILIGREAATSSLVIAQRRGQRDARDRDDGPHDGPGLAARRAARTSAASASRRTRRCRSIRTASSRSVRSRFRSSLLGQIAQALRGRRAAPLGCEPAGGRGAGDGAACRSRRLRRRRRRRRPRKHRTVIGELNLEQLQGGDDHDRSNARQQDRRPAPAGVRASRADHRSGRAALPRGPRQRQRHLRARPAPRARASASRSRTARRSTSARCRC